MKVVLQSHNVKHRTLFRTIFCNEIQWLLCTYNLKKHVKSFNNSVLIYLDKRIHYNNSSYKTRIDLATLSLNEHIDGPYTPRSN
ncbi:hypothetical protein MAR_017093 [Mya arenaria]|uniref:Uncharacterized protein n=1 Tax=Mya arenaria TaxID=6604 RepID=A0ABY7EDM3_MYAAR|nr:hypothetical protein MAR_017093 [Mya arenaria]